MRRPILIVALWLVSGAVGVGAQDQGTAADLEFAPLVQTIDSAAAGRCLNGLVGFSGVRLQCVVDADGTPGQCELINPTRTVQRYERVFRCMASRMKVTYADGSPAVGRTIEVSLGGKTAMSDDEYQRLRNAERDNP